jgi:hypothetical protein
MAFASVMKQKRLHSSLFDQRKRGNQVKESSKQNRGNVIELSRMQEESVPLFESSGNPLEVI